MRRALVPLWLLPLRLGLRLDLWLDLWLVLLLSTWVATRWWLNPRYTNKVHGTSGIVTSCCIVLGPSLDVRVVVMPVGVVDEWSRRSLSLLLLWLRVKLGLGVSVCLLWVTGAIGLSLASSILVGLNRVGSLVLSLSLRLGMRVGLGLGICVGRRLGIRVGRMLGIRVGLRLGMRVGLRLGSGRLGSSNSRLSVRGGVLLLR